MKKIVISLMMIGSFAAVQAMDFLPSGANINVPGLIDTIKTMSYKINWQGSPQEIAKDIVDVIDSYLPEAVSTADIKSLVSQFNILNTMIKGIDLGITQDIYDTFIKPALFKTANARYIAAAALVDRAWDDLKAIAEELKMSVGLATGNLRKLANSNVSGSQLATDIKNIQLLESIDKTNLENKIADFITKYRSEIHSLVS